MKRAAIELAKDWRMDRFLRRLEAMLITVTNNEMLLISGNGDVIEPVIRYVLLVQGLCMRSQQPWR